MKIKLTTSQRAAIIRIIRFYREEEKYNGVTSVRLKMVPLSYGAISVSLETRRSDCDRNSVRAVVFEHSAHFIVGTRGGITVCRASRGIGQNSNNEKYVAQMLNATRMAPVKIKTAKTEN